MTDLSHWDYTWTFSGREVCALILGLEPSDAWNDAGGNSSRLVPVLRRLQEDYERARISNLRCIIETTPEKRHAYLTDMWCIESEGMRIRGRVFDRQPEDPGRTFLTWLQSEEARFETQLFNRRFILPWLERGQLSSCYSFADPGGRPLPDVDLDPADLPLELQAANIAFRAVFNGYGDPESTFKNRLTAYLEANFVGLGTEAVKRIATVSNPDKEPGRKKVAKE